MLSQIRLSRLAVFAVLLAPAVLYAQPRGKISVVATTPDLAAIARALGGDAVDVKALAKPTEDPHFVDAKPSHVVTLNRADMLIEGGAELELGWLPPLVESARNERIGAGAPGRVNASQGIRLTEVPTSFDRSKGDVHGLGNPHFLLDPLNAKVAAGTIAERLAQIDGRNAALYEANRKKFDALVDAKLAEWLGALAPFRGAKIVTYHKDFVYLGARFGLEIVGNLEPKPGISPSPAHLARVIETMKTAKARVILIQPFQNKRTAENVARQSGGTVVLMPQQPGVLPNTDSYVALMDAVVKSLVTALGATR